MAKNVTIAGAAFSAVPSIDVPQTGGGTASFFDVSDTTATAADVAQGKVFYAADGTETTGTASGGGGDSDPYPVRGDKNLHLWVRVHENNKRVILCGSLNSNPAGTFDWGDGTTSPATTTSPNDIRQGLVHDYAAAGLYEIVFIPTSTKQFRMTLATVMGRAGTSSGNIGKNASDGILAHTGQLVAIEFPQYSSASYSGTGGSYVLGGCINLEKVTMPAISGAKFSGASAVYDDDNNPIGLISLHTFSVAEGGTVAFQATGFSGCKSLKSIDISMAASTSNYTQLFENCSALVEVTLPADMGSIYTKMFHACSSLPEIELPTTITSINGSSFADCWSLRSLTIPSLVTSIGASAFENCYSLTTLHVLPTTPPALDATALNGTPSDMVIYVPTGSLADYQAAENWSTYASQMVEE